MKYNAADMFHSTILKHAANIAHNIMMYKNASHAKNGYAIVIANMFLATTGNMFAANQIAQLLAQHATKSCRSLTLFVTAARFI